MPIIDNQLYNGQLQPSETLEKLRLIINNWGGAVGKSYDSYTCAEFAVGCQGHDVEFVSNAPRFISVRGINFGKCDSDSIRIDYLGCPMTTVVRIFLNRFAIMVLNENRIRIGAFYRYFTRAAIGGYLIPHRDAVRIWRSVIHPYVFRVGDILSAKR